MLAAGGGSREARGGGDALTRALLVRAAEGASIDEVLAVFLDGVAAGETAFDGRGGVVALDAGARALRVHAHRVDEDALLRAFRDGMGRLPGPRDWPDRVRSAGRLRPLPEGPAEGTWARSVLLAEGEVRGVLVLGLRRPLGPAEMDRVRLVTPFFASLVLRAERDRLLRRGEARFRAIAEAASDAMVVFDEKLCLGWWNPAAARLAGQPPEPAAVPVGRPLGELFGLRELPTRLWLAQAVRGGPPAKPWRRSVARLEIRDAGGGRRAVRASLARLVIDGRPAGILVMHDLTEAELHRARLERAERLASVGTLLTGIMHEVRNPLGAAALHVGLAREAVDRLRRIGGMPAAAAEELAELGEVLDDAEAAVGGVARIADDLMRLARGDRAAGEDDRADPEAVARRAARLARAEMPPGARLELDLRPAPPVRMSAGRLGQVLLNLLINAARAVREAGGTGRKVVLRLRAPGGRVSLEVRDDGVGIPEHARGRLFDPFFSTRPPGEGTGLGLWMVRELVQAVGGEVRVHSEEGAGTRFEVRLPPAGLVRAAGG